MEIGRALNPEKEYTGQIKDLSKKFGFIEIGFGEMEKQRQEIDEDKINQLRDKKDLGLIVHLPFRQPIATTVEQFNNAAIDYLEELTEYASSMGAEKAVVHANIRYGQDKEEVRETVISQMKKLDEIGEKNSVEICFENIPFEDSRAFDLDEFGNILRERSLSMCFDIGHAVAEVGQKETIEFLEKYSEVVSHIHIQDARDRQDQHLSIGDGEIDFKPICSQFQDFEGTASLEIFTDDREQIDLSRRKWMRHF